MYASMKICFELIVIFYFPLILGNCAFYQDEISYNNIVLLNATCRGSQDSCLEGRNNDILPDRFEYSGLPCTCNPQCWQYGACCIDSPFRRYTNPTEECRLVSVSPKIRAYLLISKCPYNTSSGSIWKDLCEDEWNDDDDILKLAPVTSLTTNVTYKNIYCLRCHEISQIFLQWDLALGVDNPDTMSNLTSYTVSYVQASKIWTAVSDDKSVAIPVQLNFGFPDDSPVPILKECNSHVISKCNDSWTNSYVRDMCHSYTSYRYSTYTEHKKYKNPHCAICNYVPRNRISCIRRRRPIGGGGSKKIFSFTHLIRINRGGENKAEKLQRCNENEIFDPYRKGCRKLACAVPGYVVKNGQCSRP